MSVTVYQQSRAFLSLSRYHIARFIAASSGCSIAYIAGKKLCKRTDSPRTSAYGQICKHYGKMCGLLLWSHVIVTCSGALIYAKAKNLPRAVFLQRGFVYGEQLGFGALCVYLITRELSSREWFAQISTGGYVGMRYSLMQGLKGWPAYHSTRIGVYCGMTSFVIYSCASCANELWNIFKDPQLTYSAWDNFDLEEYFLYRIKRFFNVAKWSSYFNNGGVEELIKQARLEMDELEQLMKMAGIKREDLVHVNVEEVSDTIFRILDTIKTGRPEYDDMSLTTSTVMETRVRQFDPYYEVAVSRKARGGRGSMSTF